MKNLPLAIIVLSGFLGCAQSTHKADLFYKKEGVSNSKFKDRSVFVAPLVSATTQVSNNSTLIPDGKQESKVNGDSLRRFFNSGFGKRMEKDWPHVETFKPGIDGYDSAFGAGNLIEVTQRFENNGVEYYFKYPDEKVLNSLGIKPDVILFVSSLFVSVKDEAFFPKGGGGSFGVDGVTFGSSGPSANVVFTGDGGGTAGMGPLNGGKMVPQYDAVVKYIFWDYKNKVILSCGQDMLHDFLNEKNVDESWKKIEDFTVKTIGRLNTSMQVSTSEYHSY
jgi:hypothetical protein